MKKSASKEIEYLSDEMIESQAMVNILEFNKRVGNNFSFPIYPEEILKKLWDIETEYVDVLPELEGVPILASYSPKNKKILVNSTENKNSGRLSFTLAHELGHVSLHSFAVKNQNCSNYDLGINSEKIERQADKYAAALLMPKEEVFSLLESLGCTMLSPTIDMHIHADNIKMHFGVSNEVLEYRLGNLGFEVLNGFYKKTKKKIKESMFTQEEVREKWNRESRT